MGAQHLSRLLPSKRRPMSMGRLSSHMADLDSSAVASSRCVSLGLESPASRMAPSMPRRIM